MLEFWTDTIHVFFVKDTFDVLRVIKVYGNSDKVNHCLEMCTNNACVLQRHENELPVLYSILWV